MVSFTVRQTATRLRAAEQELDFILGEVLSNSLLLYCHCKLRFLLQDQGVPFSDQSWIYARSLTGVHG